MEWSWSPHKYNIENKDPVAPWGGVRVQSWRPHSRPPDGTKRPFGTKGYNLLFSLTFSGKAPFRPNWLIELNPVVILLKTNPCLTHFLAILCTFLPF